MPLDHPLYMLLRRKLSRGKMAAKGYLDQQFLLGGGEGY